MQRMATDPRCIVLPENTTLKETKEMTAEAKALISDDNLMRLYNLGIDQGWRIVPTNNGKLMWYPPDKSQNPVTSPNRLHGRTMANVTTQLAKAGLDISSIKPDKGKSRSVRSELTLVNDGPVTPEEQVHIDIQNKAKDITAAELQKMGVQQLSEVMNGALDVFVVNSLKALIEFAETSLKVQNCGHEVNEDNVKRIEEAETLYLETQTTLDKAEERIAKLEAQVSDLGKQYAGAVKAQNDALERANKAEQKLEKFKAFRDLFKED